MAGAVDAAWAAAFDPAAGEAGRGGAVLVVPYVRERDADQVERVLLGEAPNRAVGELRVEMGAFTRKLAPGAVRALERGRGAVRLTLLRPFEDVTASSEAEMEERRTLVRSLELAFGRASAAEALVLLCCSGVRAAAAASPVAAFVRKDGDRAVLRRVAAHLSAHDMVLWGHTAEVARACFSRDGRLLASCGSDKRIQVWDARSLTLLHDVKAGTREVRSVAFSHDGRSLVSSDYDAMLQIWRVSAEGMSVALQLRANSVQLEDAAFSPDDKLVASAHRDGVVRIWKLPLKKCAKTLTGHAHVCTVVAFAPDGRTLASGGQDGTVRLWAADADFACARVINVGRAALASLSFSGDGALLATSNGTNLVAVWRAADGTRVHSLRPSAGAGSRCTGAAFAAAGSWLVCASPGPRALAALRVVGPGHPPRDAPGEHGMDVVPLWGDQAKVSVSPDARWVAATGAGPAVRLVRGSFPP